MSAQAAAWYAGDPVWPECSSRSACFRGGLALDPLGRKARERTVAEVRLVTDGTGHREGLGGWRNFDDRAPDDRRPGRARAVETSGRCANCWGTVEEEKDAGGRWVRIACRICERAVDGGEAQREADQMRREAELNMPGARTGRGSKYREDALFVVKVLPDMDRDTVAFDARVAASKTGGTKGRKLCRRKFRPGTPGYLYAQARIILSGLENLSGEMSAIALSDFDFGAPRIESVEAALADGSPQASLRVPATHRKPTDRTLLARMGTTLVAGMTASFACEVGMKAILLTRRDEAEMTHDLLDLYQALPDDSRERMEADFAGIGDVFERYRQSFGKWRYFEESVGQEAMTGLVDTDRVWELGKAARVIVDECVIAGLDFDVEIDAEFDGEWVGNRSSLKTKVGLSVTGREAAIPWDAVLEAGGD